MAHIAPLPNILEAIAGTHFPADAQAISERAEINGAAKETLRLLHRLPDRMYRNSSDVNHALGEIEDMPDPEMIFGTVSGSQELEDEAQARKSR